LTHNIQLIVPKLEPVNAPEEAMLRRELKIEQRAALEGKQNRPETKDVILDETQQAITDRCQDGVGTIRQWAVRQYKAISDQLTHADLTPEDLDLRELVTARDVELSKIEAEAKDELRRLRITERALLREQNLFQHLNNLSRSAYYPESRLFAISLLVTAVVLESILNAYLFAKANEFGLLGGWLQAFLVSATNVLAGVIFGLFVLRNLHHANVLRKAFAFIILPFGIAVLVIFNLCVAHYRDLLEINPDTALIESLDRVRASPFALTTLEALILLLIGLCVCIFSSWEGYNGLDDHYPGYGKVARRHKEALNAYNVKCDFVRKHMTKIYDDYIKAMNQKVSKVEEKAKICMSLFTQANVVTEQLVHSIDQCVRLQGRLLRLYRDTNRKVRTSPPPTYFDDFPEPVPTLVEMPVQIRQRRDEISVRLDQLRQQANTLKEAVPSEVDNRFKRFFQMIEDVERDADAVFQREEKYLARHLNKAT
jgi:hypothetical protein